MTGLALAVQTVMFCILLFKIYKFCCKRRKKTDNKKRANNGMVVGSEETDVEMADMKKPAKKLIKATKTIAEYSQV